MSARTTVTRRPVPVVVVVVVVMAAAASTVTTAATAATAAGQRQAGKAASSPHEPGCRGGGRWMLCRRLLQHADRAKDQDPNWLGHWLVTLPYPTLPYPNTADVRGTIPLDRKGHGHLRLFTTVCTILFFLPLLPSCL